MKKKLLFITIILLILIIVPASYSFINDPKVTITGDAKDYVKASPLKVKKTNNMTIVSTSIKNISDQEIRIKSFIFTLYNNKNEIIYSEQIYIGDTINSLEEKPISLTINDDLEVDHSSYKIEGE